MRGYLMGAHIEADVDRLIEATASFLAEHRELLSLPASERPAD